MTQRTISRRTSLGLLGAGVAAATLPAPALRAQTLDKFVYQTNWRAQAEHGGFYHALATGIYRKYGIDAEIRMGGPQQDPNALLVAGRVDAIMSNSFSGFRYVEENVPFVVVGSVMQKDPQVLISHPGVGNDTLPALKGKPILIGAGGRSSYWPWLRAKFAFTDDQIRPYTFNMAPFLADKNLSQQGFLTSEPNEIRKAGVEPVLHLLADYGFENYQTTINTSMKLVNEKPDLMQRFINASIEGWYGYINGDPKAANDIAVPARTATPLAANDERQDYLRSEIIDYDQGVPVLRPHARQDSSMLATLSDSDALVIRPPNAPAAETGDWCKIIPLNRLDS
ncbi:MAG: ABC transporter substrate-binding protein [Proteobacteria bacterium]|nr:ABC transporter substrate-binding protein [Pseudomonadota bacterium]